MLGSGSDDGKREEQKLKGGHKDYEYDLWSEVARLNFCLHFKSGHYKTTAYKRQRPDGSFYMQKDRKWENLHRLVGRRINVISTMRMAEYLMGAIERLVDERIGMDSADRRWSRENIVFREGAASTIINKLADRRRELLRDEERKAREAAERAEQAGTAGLATGTALTIASHAQAEEDANRDAAEGKPEGTTAAERAAWQAEHAAIAERNRLAREAHVRWAEENPEEARAQAEARRKEQEKEDKRAARNAARRKGSYGGWTKADEKAAHERQFYSMGRDAAQKISIDQQMGGGAKGGRLS